MTKEIAFFRIIQYCPDRHRAEHVNIGVIIIVDVASSTAIGTRITRDYSRIERFFGKNSFDKKRLDSVLKAFMQRLKNQRPKELLNFCDTRANEIVISAARPMNLSDDVTKDFDDLFKELVEDPKCLENTQK